jgi:hypothetical protein
MLGGQEEGTQATLPIEERKGCAFSNVVRDGPNGRCSKDLTSQFKPMPLGGERAKGKIKKPKKLYGGRA